MSQKPPDSSSHKMQSLGINSLRALTEARSKEMSTKRIVTWGVARLVLGIIVVVALMSAAAVAYHPGTDHKPDDALSDAILLESDPEPVSVTIGSGEDVSSISLDDPTPIGIQMVVLPGMFGPGEQFSSLPGSKGDISVWNTPNSTLRIG